MNNIKMSLEAKEAIKIVKNKELNSILDTVYTYSLLGVTEVIVYTMKRTTESALKKLGYTVVKDTKSPQYKSYLEYKISW